MRKTIAFLSLLFLLNACGNPTVEEVKDTTKDNSARKNPAPAFNVDSCFAYLKEQVDMGPRVPLTPAHVKCGDWLVAKLKSFGLSVIEQKGSVVAYNEKQTPVRNIIASYMPERQKRILLTSHWDSRPMADRDVTGKDTPIDGASDGASGVAVLLEIARQLQTAKPDAGIDIIFFDMEDYGNKFCQGSEYWAQNLHKAGYFANFGILLDMVGAKGAVFPIEGQSKMYAASYVKKVWDKGAALGYSDYFSYTEMRPITDDHVNINTIANIPCLDIIQMDPASGDFGPYHHRHSDNMSIIDKNTLKAVGHTLTEVIYAE
jgi:glutaminyl-peptide cyclotransferase